MSGRYVSRVLESGLSQVLKPIAVACATYARDSDGTQIRMGMKELAHLADVSLRTAKTHVQALRDMEPPVLETVRKATQHLPAHYRMVLDNLPPRAVRQPIEQLEVPLQPSPPEVQQLHPWDSRGATLDSRGATHVAPDPSIDPKNVHTQTRAREPEVQQLHPWKTPPTLPLIGSAPRPPCEHPHAHAWCEGRVHVPRFVHFELFDQLGGPIGEPAHVKAGRLIAFYARTMAAIPHEQSIGDDPPTFWRKAFAAWITSQSQPAEVTEPTAVPLKSNPPLHVWAQILHVIETRVPRHDFHMWFLQTQLVDDHGTVIEVGGLDVTRGDLVVAWIEKHYRDAVKLAADQVRPGLQVEFVPWRIRRQRTGTG
ncbi:MAG: hypothetical protein ABJA98_01525 [Acidobacteriota bacterium]